MSPHPPRVSPHVPKPPVSHQHFLLQPVPRVGVSPGCPHVSPVSHSYFPHYYFNLCLLLTCPHAPPGCPHMSPSPLLGGYPPGYPHMSPVSHQHFLLQPVPFAGVSLGCPHMSPVSRRHFPHYYYSLRLSLPGTNASARLLMLDTVLLCGGSDDFGAGGAPQGPRDAAAAAAQLAWLRGRLAAARHDRYVLVAGHYPVWSVAEHGPTTCLLRLLRPLLRHHRVTAYLCGHDHNLQFLEEGGVGYVVSGAGNFMEESQSHGGAVPPGSLRFFFGAPTSPGGFAHLRLDAHAATITFLEATGRVLYRVALPPRDL
uniref:Acid phosphatase 5, tartrate resistant n=1 Tax=Falco tinnunculus TaxID=100819 RepID=A0A8C4UE45_FALTI